jgi:hypothetical protein
MTADALHRSVAAALHPTHFFVAASHSLRFAGPQPEHCAWELFRGHLLDRTQTRLEREFTSWHVYLDEDEEPILSVKFDEAERCFYVVRALKVLGHEAFDSGGAIDSRPAEKWLRELVGSVDLKLARNGEHLQELVQQCLFLAVVGTSRLPITSLESPLPAFSLGILGYVYGSRSETLQSKIASLFQGRQPPSLFQEPLSYFDYWARRATSTQLTKLLEFTLRSLPEEQLPALQASLLDAWTVGGDCQTAWTVLLAPLNRALFQELALTPYTAFVDRWLKFLRRFVSPHALGPIVIIHLLGYFLRYLARHLTAYDLTKFHNRGANYPDALFLDAVLRDFLELLPRTGSYRSHRIGRRALRQGWLLRKQLEGLPVPDQPTSPGENLRILPAPFQSVPEEQLAEPRRRSKRLFEGQPAEALLDSATQELLQESLDDLAEDRELLELGMAVFLDRPLGVFKQPGEVDRTPLLSYEAFSRQIARRRLSELHRWGLMNEEPYGKLVKRLDELVVRGIPVSVLPGRERPGVIALEDARGASPDFVILRSLRSSMSRFWEVYDPSPLGAEWCRNEFGDGDRASHVSLLIRTPSARRATGTPFSLTGYDRELRPRIELVAADSPQGRYLEHAGGEFLRGGLRVLRVIDASGRENQPANEKILMPNLDAELDP